MASVRWAFRCQQGWKPSRDEWLQAARSVQSEEMFRIGQFVFAKDAKSAMAGRLLMRSFICEYMELKWSEFTLRRSDRGKPYLENPPKDLCPVDWPWSFNVSHQGEYAVLAALQGLQVGVDVMKTTMPGNKSVSEFFRVMTRQFTEHEWSVIQSSGSEHQQITSFYRHWALKESYIKAIGTGLGFNLQRLEFHLGSDAVAEGRVIRQTKMYLDGEEERDWMFEESLLDADHHVAVAIGPTVEPDAGLDPLATYLSNTPYPFKLVSFSDLISKAKPLTEEDPTYWDSYQLSY